MANRRPYRQTSRGFVLIAMSAVMLLLLGLVGLAFDLGRVYIACNEAQLFTDAAALAAARNLDGSSAGIERAKEAVGSLRNRWNLGTESFDGVRLEFSEDRRSVRAMAPSNEIAITFLRVVGTPEKLAVSARSAASTKPIRLIE